MQTLTLLAHISGGLHLHPGVATIMIAAIVMVALCLRVERRRRSAGFQPAVSRISNPPDNRPAGATRLVRTSQAGSPAIQQTGSLRYEGSPLPSIQAADSTINEVLFAQR